MNPDLLYQIALTQVPLIGAVQARILLTRFGNAKTIFLCRESHLRKIEGIGESRAQAIKSFRNFQQAEAELRFIEKYGIKPLTLTDPHYPQRLLNCYDPPVLLYYKGAANLNASRMIAVIGTRHHTDYGRHIAEKLVEELAGLQVTIVSGLAFGIDGIAHKASLRNKLPTIGVLAHGLDQVYPPQHGDLAKDMIREGGGLLTEFPSCTRPDRHHFPSRNRIVAGLCDATIVVETGVKGGSIITAELANDYNRDVFAFPGKVTEPKSAGCHHLIRQNKAQLISAAADLSAVMNWSESKKAHPKKQKDIFVDLGPGEKKILALLEEKGALHIDELNLRSGLSSSAVAAAVLNLEIQNIVVSLPGKMIRVL